MERRVRAGLREHNTVQLFEDLGVADRLHREGLVHGGIHLRHPRGTQHIDITELTGRRLTIYGQQEVVKDLIAAWDERGGGLPLRRPGSGDRLRLRSPAATASTASAASPSPRGC